MNLRPTQIGVLASTAVIVLASFLFPFYAVDSLSGEDLGDIKDQCDEIDFDRFSGQERDAVEFTCGLADDGGFKAWDFDFFAPLSAWPALLALGGLVVAGLAYFKGTSLTLLGFTTPQLLVALGLASSVVMLGWFLEGSEDEMSQGPALWLMLLGALAWTGTAIVDLKAEGGSPGAPGAGAAGPGHQPPSPF